MKTSLENKVVIITGCSGDIGKAMTREFRKRGAKVYGFDLKKGIDITSQAITSLIQKIYDDEKRIDILVNNAGITLPNKFERYNQRDWDRTISVNLTAPFRLSQLVSKYMKRNGGSIINITSLWSERGFPNNPAYGASKGGLKQLTKCMACDLAKYKIRVNNLGFGYIKTGMTKKSWAKMRGFIASKTLLKRWGFPHDIVKAAVFLASDDSRYITGQDLYIDGGWLAKGL